MSCGAPAFASLHCPLADTATCVMIERCRTWLVLAILCPLASGCLATDEPPQPTPNPPDTFSFAALGDAPYSASEERRYRVVLNALNAHDLSWTINVGDIFWRPCTDEMYRRSLGWYNALAHPVIYTPGDNEWTDCWEPRSGSFQPLERLNRLRQIFFASPNSSLGANPMPLVNQAGGSAEYSDYPENVRWSYQGIVFATVHLVGSRNGFRPFPGRTLADDDQARHRTAAAVAWLRDTFVDAVATDASAVVIGFHGDPGFEAPPNDPYRQSYEPFLTMLEEQVEQFRKPVLVIHGDGHDYIVDRPLVRRATGERLENLTRLEVPGSPDVGWVRVFVRPGEETAFAFEQHLVSRWDIL